MEQRVYLERFGPDGRATVVTITDQYMIGRAAQHYGQTSDQFMSATHALVEVGRDGVSLSDLGSTNGTFVRVRPPMRLTSGCIFAVGTTLYRFVLPDAG